jgi:hypothetical protein
MVEYMPAAVDVTPGKRANIRVLFDNGWYSVVAGEYEGEYAMGGRWNGGDHEPGFPSQGGHPLWHVVPDFLRLAVLNALREELSRNDGDGSRRQAEAVLRKVERLSRVKRR